MNTVFTSTTGVNPELMFLPPHGICCSLPLSRFELSLQRAGALGQYPSGCPADDTQQRSAGDAEIR